MKKKILGLTLMGGLAAVSNLVLADTIPNCTDINNAINTALSDTQTTWYWLQNKLAYAITQQDPNGHDHGGGFPFNSWATIVDRDGVVCAVAFTGDNRGDQWPGSRAISAQKANTANAFSLPAIGSFSGLALSTANLYTATQPGGSLFGLQFSNPVDTSKAYDGALPNTQYGQLDDPLVNNKMGGVNVFGGGLALYDSSGTLLGAIGTSGNSSCADHNISWLTRHFLGLDYVPKGVSGDTAHPDNIVYDIKSHPFQMNGISASGWGHPTCGNNEVGFTASLPAVP